MSSKSVDKIVNIRIANWRRGGSDPGLGVTVTGLSENSGIRTNQQRSEYKRLHFTCAIQTVRTRRRNRQ